MSATATAPTPTVSAPSITAEEFLVGYGGRHAEIVRGIIVEDEVPSFRHGKICAEIARRLANFVDANDLGHVMSNDSLILIQREPLTVRGPDVCYFSYARLPKGDVPDGYLEVAPDLVAEVRSPSNTWSRIFAKVGEYLSIGVTAVVVFDPDTATASVYRPEELQRIFDTGDDLVVPDALPGFAVPVRKFFL